MSETQSTPEPTISIQGLRFSYPGRPPALRDVRLEIGSGECVALVGPNGAGKTSLFLCMTGVLRSKPGMIRVAGLDPADGEQRRKLPAQIGILFQDSDDQIFSATVFDDVAFGPLNLGLAAEEVKHRVADALARVHLEGYEDRVPFHLSGGEKRRVALAGLLAMGPRILLLDEPSLHLDPRGRRELIALIRDVGGTQLIASHDLELVRQTCSRVVLLDGGEVVATGATDTILADRELMERHGLEVPYSLRG